MREEAFQYESLVRGVARQGQHITAFFTDVFLGFFSLSALSSLYTRLCKNTAETKLIIKRSGQKVLVGVYGKKG